MSDELIHLHKAHVEGHSKYVYFLLAATGAALGYALQKLDVAVVQPAIWLGLGAIASWLGSFLCGCKHLTSIQSVIDINFQMRLLTYGRHPKQPATQQETLVAESVAEEKLKKQNVQAQKWFKRQFILLLIGVILYTAWRVLLLFQPHLDAP